MVLTWEFLSHSKLKVEALHIHFLSPRENDSFLMEAFAYHDLGDTDFICVNRCRIYLQALTLSDITDACGKTVPSSYMNGRRSKSRTSFYKWPNQSRPPETDWTKWRKYLRLAYLHPRTNRLRHPLGRWTRKPHQHWIWSHDPLTDSIYRQDGNVDRCYALDRMMRSNTRSSHSRYKLDRIVPITDASILRPCTISTISRSSRHIWLSSSASSSFDNLPPMVDLRFQSSLMTPYFYFRILSDNDEGETICHLLQNSTGVLVGNGSYERKSDLGSCSFILEDDECLSRVTNSHLVSSNTGGNTWKWNDPYCCELCDI